MIRKYYIPDEGGTGGGDKPAPPAAPANYTPLKPEERQQWNDFLDYVDKQGLGGSTKLDARDQKLGLNLMQQYKKANPNFTLTPDDVQRVQYDQYLLRKGDSYPTLTQPQLQYVRSGLNPAYMQREVSQPDNWFGSLTSKEYYPIAQRASKDAKYNFGTSVEDYVNSLNNPDLQQKYLVKNQ